MAKEINIFLADDDPIFKSLITKYISVEACGRVQVLSTASNGKDLLDQLDASTTKLPDIILLDIQMPLLNGISTARILRKQYPKIKIIAITDFDFENNILEMNKLGVKSFIAKSQQSELIRAITIVHEGGVFFPDNNLNIFALCCYIIF